jgi:hypothetical protein
LEYPSRGASPPFCAEDHAAAMMCNAMFILHYQAMIERGVLPASLDDRPNYQPSPPPRHTEAQLDAIVELVRKS